MYRDTKNVVFISEKTVRHYLNTKISILKSQY